MQQGPQLLVKFKSGDQVLFDIGSHEDFVRLVEEVAKLWGANWIYIGSNAVVRKKDIRSIFYVKDGWNAQSSQSSLPQD